MKALTLWQPWASLVSWGEKRHETRGWKTDYRGPLAIHAAMRFTQEQKTVVWQLPFAKACIRHGINGLCDFPLGKVLCVVDIVDVVQVREVDRGVVFGSMLTQKEEAFGDYSHGRYAWKFENLRVLSRPSPARGHQGIWEWTVQMEQLEFRT